jgi:hypothetical protein
LFFSQEALGEATPQCNNFISLSICSESLSAVVRS